MNRASVPAKFAVGSILLLSIASIGCQRPPLGEDAASQAAHQEERRHKDIEHRERINAIHAQIVTTLHGEDAGKLYLRCLTEPPQLEANKKMCAALVRRRDAEILRIMDGAPLW